MDPDALAALNQIEADRQSAPTPSVAEPEPLAVADEPVNEAPAEDEGADAEVAPEEGEAEATVDEPGEQPAKRPAKLPPDKQAGVDKRIRELTRARYEAEERARAAEDRLAAMGARATADDGDHVPDNSVDPKDFKAQVQAEAAKLRAAEARDAAAAEFNERCNKVFEDGAAKFEDFATARDGLVGSFGRVINNRPEFLQAIVRMDNGADVFHYFGSNLDDAARILKLPAVDMIMEMRDLSLKMKAPPKPKPVSRAPAPIEVVGGGARKGSALSETSDMNEFADELFKSLNARRAS